MELLASMMKALGIEASNERLETFNKYRRLVLEWNQKVNLTAVKDPLEFEIKHFVDSLMAAAYKEFQKAETIIDIGTGAGFPGLPLAVCYPQKHFILLDSLNKRIKILNQIIEELHIYNAIAVHGRAEDLANQSQHREKYDMCLSRAVADLSVLSEYCLPFVKTGGYFGAYKTVRAQAELNSCNKALRILGGRYETFSELPIGGVETNHRVIWIRKIVNTPSGYPRKAGIPSKEPIK